VLITDMNQPLGRAVGNSLELIEAFETLKGRGGRLQRAVRELSAEMLVMGQRRLTPTGAVDSMTR
jgi:pyrimidine-nucleoside phosphorylase